MELNASKRRAVGEKQSMDRISELPEPIMHQILALLPAKDATRTSCWSKTWNAAWTSSPVLDFNHAAFSGNGRRQTEFCSYVDKCIKRSRQSNFAIQKFRLSFNILNLLDYETRGMYWYNNSEYVHKWLDYAINDNKLDQLVVHCNHDMSYFGAEHIDRLLPCRLPEFVFSDMSLKELDLYGCRIDTNTNIGLLSLKTLRLAYVEVDQETLDGLFSRCCLLEEVSIENCEGFATVKIAGLKLKKVDLILEGKLHLWPSWPSPPKLKDAQRIQIEAPNLRLLSYRGESRKIKNSIAGCNCKNLKELVFYESSLTSDILRAIPSQFPVLERIELHPACTLELEDDACYGINSTMSVQGCDMVKRFCLS